MATNSNLLKYKAELLRIHSLNMTTAASSGHPTTCLSAAEIMSVLFFDEMTFDPKRPEALDNDDFILSKGHAAPVLYSAYAEAGTIPVTELNELRDFSSRLEGHPIPGKAPGVRVATGSLGQGLAAGIGMALAINHDQGNQRVFVLLGDGEMAEGSVWEAMNLAPSLGVGNLCAVLDMNRLGQSDPTMFGWDSSNYAAKAEAFGWDVYECDGHDIEALQQAFKNARKSPRPSFIVAKTIKGKGVSFLENVDTMHGKAVSEDDLRLAITEIEQRLEPTDEVPANFKISSYSLQDSPKMTIDPNYQKGEKIATRRAYGTALQKLGARFPNMFVLDADVKNSTYTDAFFKAFPDRSIECFIAEQNMVGIATGLQTRGKIPFAATFAAFLTRAFDHIRMAAHSQANIKIAGSHTGVSIGEDGASQMGLEDVAMFRAVQGSVVLCPADGVAAEKLTCESANYNGVSYVRTARPDVPIVYDNFESFPIGGSKVLSSSSSDIATLVASGVTLHEAVEAARLLSEEGLAVRVIDCYSIKPIDKKTIRIAAKETKLVITIEDHFPEGGMGEAVTSVLTDINCLCKVLAVEKVPHSGKGADLLIEQGLDASSIVGVVKKII